jgi:ornithine carbamoyltransferase
VGVLSRDANILRSWIEAAAVLPLRVTQVFAERWHARASTARFTATADITAVRDVDVLVTDCWPSDGDREDFAPYQVTETTLEQLSSQALFLPCPPVSRGQEVTHEAMTNARCRVTEAKAYLLHAQNAVLEWLLQG